MELAYNESAVAWPRVTHQDIWFFIDLLLNLVLLYGTQCSKKTLLEVG